MSNIKNRIGDMWDNENEGFVEWKLKDGSRVSYDRIELFAALSDLMMRVYRAMKEEDPGSLPPPAQAVLDCAPSERARLDREISWAPQLESYYLPAANPAPEDVKRFQEML